MTFRILSLSGGGFMGLYSALVLSEIEARSGVPIAERFDLIAGTSIGGIIGLGLVAGVPARDIVASFEDRGEAIFSGRTAPKSPHQLAMDVLRFIRGAKYSNEALRTTIQEILGDTRMKELGTRVLVPAVDIDAGRPHLFRGPDCAQGAELLALDVAMATSAAPTIFPLHPIDGVHYADGGVYAQSPDVLALTEARVRLGKSEEEISMLSVGTTTQEFEFGPMKSASMGLTDWIENQRILRLSWAMQQQCAGHIAGEILGSRYLRLDSMQSMRDMACLGLDVAAPEARARLRNMARARISGLSAQETAWLNAEIGAHGEAIAPAE